MRIGLRGNENIPNNISMMGGLYLKAEGISRHLDEGYLNALEVVSLVYPAGHYFSRLESLPHTRQFCDGRLSLSRVA